MKVSFIDSADSAAKVLMSGFDVVLIAELRRHQPPYGWYVFVMVFFQKLTPEQLAELRGRTWRVNASRGSLNCLIGAPVTDLAADDDGSREIEPAEESRRRMALQTAFANAKKRIEDTFAEI